MKKYNKPELSESDKKTLADYASKYAALRESFDKLSAENGELEAFKDSASDQKRKLRENANAERREFTEDERALYSKLLSDVTDAYTKKEELGRRMMKTRASMEQIIHAAATVAAECLMRGKYAAAKFGEKTREKFTADATELLSEFGTAYLYISAAHNFGDPMPRHEIYISTGNYYRYEKIYTRYGRKSAEDFPIFYTPKMPAEDSPEKIAEFFKAIEAAEESFKAVAEAFKKWREENARVFGACSADHSHFMMAATAPKLEAITH